MVVVGLVIIIFVLILIKEGINNNLMCMKNLFVFILVEFFVVSIINYLYYIVEFEEKYFKFYFYIEVLILKDEIVYGN